MKELLVCLLICVLASFTVLRIEGTSITSEDVYLNSQYEGADAFVLTVGEEEQMSFVIMKDGKIIRVDVVSREELDTLIRKQMLERGI